MLESGFLIHFPFEIQHFYLFADLQSAQRPLSPVAEKISAFNILLTIYYILNRIFI
jgi:hypothetical protein